MGMKDEIITHFRHKSDGMVDLSLNRVSPYGTVINYDYDKYEVAGQHAGDMLCNLCGPKFAMGTVKIISDPVNHPEDEVTVTSVVNALSKLRPSEIHVYMKNDAMEMKVEVVFKK